jgi:ribosome recycling factor
MKEMKHQYDKDQLRNENKKLQKKLNQMQDKIDEIMRQKEKEKPII